MKPLTSILRLVAIVLTLAFVAAACGDSDSDSSSSTTAQPVAETSTTTTAPTTTEAPATTEAPVETSEAPSTTEVAADDGDDMADGPSRIVSLSPSSTELLFAIGAGDQVVAVDEFSYYPPEAPVTDLSGFTPNVEAILSHEPDLVVWQGGPEDVAAALDSAGVPIVAHFAASTFDDIYAQALELGEITGNEEGAEALVDDMRTTIEELAATIEPRDEPLTYFHEVGTEYYTATSATFVGEVYGLAGLVNIADEADPDGEFFGYPQVGDEFILGADPDLIFLADTIGYGQTADTVSARPGWADLDAVKNGNVIELNDDIVSRWGPRVVDFVEAVVVAVNNHEG